MRGTSPIVNPANRYPRASHVHRILLTLALVGWAAIDTGVLVFPSTTGRTTTLTQRSLEVMRH
ncbi:MAG: hypothetical protein J7641_18530 [Cyanobacteria bacterium SID2]|nr:hypothetical protein [Cyanobacteria bacterium SID2]MBP0002212.1 hypothetical protein [Cyanobacteria bacterium SBC]